METTHRLLNLVLSTAHADDSACAVEAISVPAALAQLRRQPGVVEAGFSPAGSVADVVIDPTRVSLGDVVRLLEDAGVNVNAVASVNPNPRLALVRA